MSLKKIITVSVFAVLLLGCISTVSAGWFDFGNQLPNDEIVLPDEYISVSYPDDGLSYIELMQYSTTHRDVTRTVNDDIHDVHGYYYRIAGTSTKYVLFASQLDLYPDKFSIDGSNEDITSFNETLNHLDSENFDSASGYVEFYDNDGNKILTKNLTNANLSIGKFIPKTSYGAEGNYFVNIRFNEELNESYESLYSQQSSKDTKGKATLYVIINSNDKNFLVSIPVKWNTNSENNVDFVD